MEVPGLPGRKIVRPFPNRPPQSAAQLTSRQLIQSFGAKGGAKEGRKQGRRKKLLIEGKKRGGKLPLHRKCAPTHPLARPPVRPSSSLIHQTYAGAGASLSVWVQHHHVWMMSEDVLLRKSTVIKI